MLLIYYQNIIKTMSKYRLFNQCLSYNPDSKTLFAGGYDGNITYFRIEEYINKLNIIKISAGAAPTSAEGIPIKDPPDEANQLTNGNSKTVIALSPSAAMPYLRRLREN